MGINYDPNGADGSLSFTSGGMNATGYLSGIGYGFSAIAAALSSYRSSSAQKIADNYQAAVAANNAQIAQWDASAAITKGQTAEESSDLKTGAMYSSQRADMAANGVDITESDSAKDVLASTKYVGDVNAAQIHDNAMREAWGYQVAGINATNQGAFYSSAAKGIDPLESAGTALATTGATVASRWYSSYQNGSFAGSAGSF